VFNWALYEDLRRIERKEARSFDAGCVFAPTALG